MLQPEREMEIELEKEEKESIFGKNSNKNVTTDVVKKLINFAMKNFSKRTKNNFLISMKSEYTKDLVD